MVNPDDLQGTRGESTDPKTLFIKMIPGHRPEVTFTGFWTGRMLRPLMSTIARAYRTRKNNVVNVKPKQEDKGDERI